MYVDNPLKDSKGRERVLREGNVLDGNHPDEIEFDGRRLHCFGVSVWTMGDKHRQYVLVEPETSVGADLNG